MGDSFWSLLLELPKHSKFQFCENAGISLQHERLFYNKKSTLFRLIRNYVLMESDKVGDGFDRRLDLDLGWFEMKWDINTTWEELVQNSSICFKIVHRLNYMLWKAHRIEKKLTS